jgi:hypothetical protein
MNHAACPGCDTRAKGLRRNEFNELIPASDCDPGESWETKETNESRVCHGPEIWTTDSIYTFDLEEGERG